MATEIVAAIPEYRELLDGPNARLIRMGIKQNVATFVDLAAPTATTALRDDMYRRFGRFEAYEGRSLDMLQDAYRPGCQVALRRARHLLATETGVAPERSIAHCDDHLVRLWLLGDPTLVRRMTSRYLSAPAGMTPIQHHRLTDTLRVWPTTRGTAAEIARILGVHP
ncbi:hypothetical protein ACFQMG_05985 [Kitasatospora paranensis]|uniref:PucR-like N-terminal domain-containing protein n=1 Tax=Kitasatospora paranensis TaxID=258053 RepID=A0ABW2FS34_9ACTN